MTNKITKQTALKTVIVVVVVAGIAGAAMLSAQRYQDYKTNKHNAEVAAAKQEASEQLQADLQHNALVQGYHTLFAECQKGTVAYNALTPVLKTKVQAPSCGSGEIN